MEDGSRGSFSPQIDSAGDWFVLLLPGLLKQREERVRVQHLDIKLRVFSTLVQRACRRCSSGSPTRSGRSKSPACLLPRSLMAAAMMSAVCSVPAKLQALLINSRTGMPFQTCGSGSLPPVPCRSITMVANPSGENCRKASLTSEEGWSQSSTIGAMVMSASRKNCWLCVTNNGRYSLRMRFGFM